MKTLNKRKLEKLLVSDVDFSERIIVGDEKGHYI